MYDCNQVDIRVNELDLTRAGIVSVQKVLPDDNRSWQVDYEISGVFYRVIGNALHGRPHGSDADVLLALQTIFFRAGCPETNRIEALPSAILSMANLPDNGRNYARLRDALLRLFGVKWSLTRTAWNEQKNRHEGETTGTGLLSDLRLLDYSSGKGKLFHERELSESSPVEITFTATFAASIRAGLFQMLDAELLNRLGQPTARSLYRVLQAHRVRPDGSLASELTIPIRDWLLACGLELERVDNSKRTLELAHDRLLEESYLKDAAFAGRGKFASVAYRFSSSPEPLLVDLMMERGITRPVAESLSADHPDRIRAAMKAVDERLASGWKPRSVAASLVDAIRNPDKWGLAAKAPVKARKAPATKKRTPSPQPSELDPREALASLLRVQLKRPVSPLALDTIKGLSDEGVAMLRAALKRPAAEALPLAQAILNAPL